MGATTFRENHKKDRAKPATYLAWRLGFVVLIVAMFGFIAAKSLLFLPAKQSTAESEPEMPSVGTKLPPFTLIPLGQSLMSGQAFGNQQLEGHKTIFVLVKATCPHCLRECAWLSSYLPKIKGRGELVVASISSAEETAGFAASTGLTEGLYFNASPLAIATGINSVPNIFLLDETGAIRFFHQGEMEPQKLEQLLDNFLQGKDVSTFAVLTKTSFANGRLA